MLEANYGEAAAAAKSPTPPLLELIDRLLEQLSIEAGRLRKNSELLGTLVSSPYPKEEQDHKEGFRLDGELGSRVQRLQSLIHEIADADDSVTRSLGLICGEKALLKAKTRIFLKKGGEIDDAFV